MDNFRNFIGKRFGYDDTATAVEGKSVQQQATPLVKEFSVSDTPANRYLMDRFCQVQ